MGDVARVEVPLSSAQLSQRSLHTLETSVDVFYHRQTLAYFYDMKQIEPYPPGTQVLPQSVAWSNTTGLTGYGNTPKYKNNTTRESFALHNEGGHGLTAGVNLAAGGAAERAIAE